MAVRWKAGQRRKRWTEQAVRLPRSVQAQLREVGAEEGFFQPFAHQLQAFGELPSTFAQIAATKPLSDALFPALKSARIAAETALRLFVELLFLDNSRPLHRGLLTTLSRLSEDMEDMVTTAFRACCLEYGAGGIKHRRFSLVGIVSSVSNLSQPGILKTMTRALLNSFTLSACYDVSWVLEHANQGGRPPPNTMEDCQDAMGSLYYTLQQNSNSFGQSGLDRGGLTEDGLSRPEAAELNGGPATNTLVLVENEGKDCSRWPLWSGLKVYGVVVRTLLNVLQTSALSRDCVVAAGVGLSAAAQFHVSVEEVALLFARSVFCSSKAQTFAILALGQGLNSGPENFGMLEAAIVTQHRSTLVDEVSTFTDFGRLCVLRGLLTALPRPALNVTLLTKNSDNRNTMDDSSEESEQKWQVWTLLYEGILPALCAFCEGSVDSHFKFHTVTALQICLQQVRASVTGNLTLAALERLAEVAQSLKVPVSKYSPLPATMVSRILQVVWNNWEDPLTQTVKQVQAVFDLLVDVQFVFTQQKGDCAVTNGEFVQQIAANLLAEGRYRKGKYVPLASLALRIGSEKLMSMSPSLLFDTFHAQSDDDVCCCASTFLKTFLERLKEDCWSSQGGVIEGDRAFRRMWVPPLLSVLLSGNSRLRSNLNTYALPVAIKIDPDSVIPILAFILDGSDKFGTKSMLSWDELQGALELPLQMTMHQRVAALISVLKVARSLALIDGDIEQPSQVETSISMATIDIITTSVGMPVIFWVQKRAIHVPMPWLEQALTHLDDSLRVDAAELICLNPKTATMPSSLELRMLHMSIPLNMRCSSTSFRMRWTSLLKKFFQRVRTAAWRQHRLDAEPQSAKVASSTVSYGEDIKKKKRIKDKLQSNGNEEKEQDARPGVTIPEMQEFMQMLSQSLLSSLYPSAPYERKNMAMELLNAIIEVWPLASEKNPSGMTSPKVSNFSPYLTGLLSAEAVLVVVGAIVDSWDKLRESAFRILQLYPTPLPGLESTTAIEHVIHWAKGLVNSPRVREADAGALVLRLIFRKYVLDLGWTVNVHAVAASPNSGEATRQPGPQRIGVAIAEYFESLNDWLEWGIEEGDRDLLKACSHSFVHGVLLGLRYTMEELPWASAAVQLGVIRLRAALHKLISLLLRVTALALWVVSADALNLPPGMTSGAQMGDDVMDIHDDDGDFEDGEGVAPVEQMIMVGCWLSMKEISLLLGTIARGIPLPGDIFDVDTSRKDDVGVLNTLDEKEGPSGLLNTEQLEAMGAHFLQVLLAMKHNGAIDKTRAGFIALCDRLLRSHDPRLNKLPETWMTQLLNRTGAEGQTVDNLLRRSAGIPAAFLALFLSEPDGAPKKLLPMAMRWLIDTSETFVAQSTSQNQAQGVASGSRSDGEDLVMVVNANGNNLELQNKMKARDEGVVPTVHCFNVMRVAFHDTNLATDTSGFCAEGLKTAIQAFSCPHWEVRNSATLSFTALVHRTIGFLNVYKRESARRAITGFEFFHRYPSLHPFLLQELRSATLQLENEAVNAGYSGDGMASTLHPSLGPVLIILSRLKPSVISSGVGDWLSPSAFRPYVTSCATQRNFHVRVLASRALAPLVSSEDLPTFLLELSQSLPAANDQRLSFNFVHGVLVQMTVLLTVNCASLPDLDIRQTIVMKLSSVIETHLWLGSIWHCPCYMVIGAFFSMLEGMLELARSCGQGPGYMATLINNLQSNLLSLSSECLKGVSGDTTSWHESMQVNLQEQAAKLYFSTALSVWPFKSRSEIATWERDLKTSITENGMVERDTLASDRVLPIRDLGSMFKRALSHRMYEVRLATLKVLKVCFSSLALPTSEGAGWISSLLQPLLINCLSSERHPGCICRILQVFFAWRSITYNLRPGEVKLMSTPEMEKGGWGASSLVLWDRVLEIYTTSRHTKTKEVAMRCMGVCLNQMLEQLRQSVDYNVKETWSTGAESHQNQDGQNQDGTLTDGLMRDPMPWERVKRAVDDWLWLVSEHSAASESVKFRRATAEAIVASGLLEEISWVALKVKEAGNTNCHEPGMVEWYGRSVLQVWSVSVKLLEDEDVELRKSLALCLLEVLASSSGTTGDKHVSAAVPAQVERVVQLVFECLSAHFGTWRVYWEVLADWVLGSEDVAASLVRDVDLVRRLFDKEIDNHHEEELVFVQLCCLHLHQLVHRNLHSLHSRPGAEFLNSNFKFHNEFVTVWRKKFLEQCKSCAQLTLRLQDKMQWVGGVTNHQDAFKMVYRRLLGLWTLAGPCDDIQNRDLKEGLLELSELLQRLPLNPLVANAVYKVLEAYEGYLDVDLGAATYRGSMGLAYCDRFEPLFLIQ